MGAPYSTLAFAEKAELLEVGVRRKGGNAQPIEISFSSEARYPDFGQRKERSGGGHQDCSAFHTCKLISVLLLLFGTLFCCFVLSSGEIP